MEQGEGVKAAHIPVALDEVRFEDRIADIVRRQVRALDGLHRRSLEEHERQLRSQLLAVGHEAGLIPNARDLELCFPADNGIGSTFNNAYRGSGTPHGTPHAMSLMHSASQSWSNLMRRFENNNTTPNERGTPEDDGSDFTSTASQGGGLGQPIGPLASSMALAPSSSRVNIFRLLPDWHHSGENAPDIDEAQLRHLQYYAGLHMLLNRGTRESKLELGSGASFVLKPTAKPKIFWDILASLLLIYDVILIPMAPFQIPREGFIFAMGVLVTFFWTVDICFNFFVGYNLPDGECELQLLKVMRRYLSTWFMPDLGIVSLDWLTYGIPFLVAGGEDSSMSPVDSLGIARAGKLARFVRLLRVLRLARFHRLHTIIQYFQDVIGMESSAILFSLAQNVALILLINHLIACCWFWIGLLHEDEGWLKGVLASNKRWYDNYLRSLYWSISNFTPGSSGIQPATTEELAFSVVVLFFALVCFSVFVSSTTSLITRLMGIQSSKTQQLWVLKGFLLQHKFEADLRDRVLRYVNMALGTRKDLIHRSDVHLLAVLSQPLREEVQLSLHLATLRVHPFFKLVSYTSPVLMRKISVEALNEVAFSRSDILFSVGEDTDRMGFVVSGVLHYTGMITGSSEEQPSQLLGPQESFCEAVLWTKWHCRGTMQADADCDLLELIGAQFRTCLKRHHLVTGLVQQYAEAFVEVLNLAAQDNFSMPLSDLQAPYVTEGEPITKVLEPRFLKGFHHSKTATHFNKVAGP